MSQKLNIYEPKREKVRTEMNRIEIGDRYGSLEVIEDKGRDKNHHHKYVCQCYNCGHNYEIDARVLIKGTYYCKNCGKGRKDEELPEEFIKQMM